MSIMDVEQPLISELAPCKLAEIPHKPSGNGDNEFGSRLLETDSNCR